MTWVAFVFRRMSSPGLLLIWVDRPWAFVASSCDTTLGSCSSRYAVRCENVWVWRSG